MKKPKLSCVIITLNEEVWLPRLLESLKKQTFQDFEVIVADADSTDKTRDIAFEYGCKIVTGGNYTVGRNNGGFDAKAPYILFLDADSELPEDFIEVNFREFKKSKKGAGTVEVKPISDRYFDKIFFKLYEYYSRMMFYFSPVCAGCGIFVKKSVFIKMGGFDENVVFAENHDFSRRAKPFGFVILPREMYTSVRRLDKDGRPKFVVKYLYAGLYRIFYKEIEKEIFSYDNDREIN